MAELCCMDVCALRLLSEQAEDSHMDTGPSLLLSVEHVKRTDGFQSGDPSQCWRARCEHLLLLELEEFLGLSRER